MRDRGRDREGFQPPHQLKPPVGASFYETSPLARGKRRRADDGDEEDTTYQYDTTLQANQREQPENNPQHGSEHFSQNIDDDATQADSPNPVKKRKIEKANAADENETRTTITGLEVDIDGSWSIDHKEYLETFHDQLFTPKYTHGRASGAIGEQRGKFDKTAYLHAQKDWGKSRDHRPAILFELKKLENAYPATDPPALTCIKNGISRVVIDSIRKKPLRAFQHIPAAVSTKVEGWLQEAWFRQDSGLQAEDLIQRMPYTAEHGVYNNRKIINRLVRRRELFRDEGRCLSWKKARYEKICDLDLIDKVTRTPNPAAPNSTRHLADLTSEEIQAFKDATYTTKKYLQRGKGRGLQGERRAQKDQEVRERIATRAAEAVTTAVESQTANKHPGDSQAQRGGNSTQPARAHAVCNMTAVQPQQRLAPQAVGYQRHSTAPPDIQSTARRTTTNRYHHQQDYNDFPGGYQDHAPQGYPVQSAAPQAMEYPFLSSMDGSPQAIGYSFPPSTDDSERLALPSFRPTNQRYVTQRPGGQPRDLAAHQSRVANLQAPLETQVPHQRSNTRNNFSRLSGVLDRSESTRQAIAQAASADFVGGPMLREIRAQPYPVGERLDHNVNADYLGSQWALVDADQGNDLNTQESMLNLSDYNRNTQIPVSNPSDFDRNTQISISSGLGYDTNTQDFLSNELNYDRSGLHASGIANQQQPLPAQQGPYSISFEDESDDFWRFFDTDTQNDQEIEYPEYDPGLCPDPVDPYSSRQYATRVDAHAQQGGYLGLQRYGGTATGHTSSRKRGAEADFDHARGSVSRKSRRLN